MQSFMRGSLLVTTASRGYDPFYTYFESHSMVVLRPKAGVGAAPGAARAAFGTLVTATTDAAPY